MTAWRSSDGASEGIGESVRIPLPSENAGMRRPSADWISRATLAPGLLARRRLQSTSVLMAHIPSSLAQMRSPRVERMDVSAPHSEQAYTPSSLPGDSVRERGLDSPFLRQFQQRTDVGAESAGARTMTAIVCPLRSRGRCTPRRARVRPASRRA